MRILNFIRHYCVIPILLVLATAVFLASPLQAQATPTAIVAAPALNVREGPGVGYNVVTVVYQNQVLNLLGRNDLNTWVKIRTAGTPREGWVSLALLQTSANVGALPVVDIPTFQNTAVVNTGRANVRLGDTTQYAVVTTVGLGETVTLLGRNANGSWVQMRTSGGAVGWMNASELTPNRTLISSLAVVPVPLLTDANRDRSNDPPTGTTAVVAAGFLNVRRGPGVAYDILTSLQRDQRVPLVARTHDLSWVVIRTPSGQEGWVNASYLIYTLDLTTLPVPNVPAPTTAPAQTTTTPTTDPAATASVNVALNVRSGPSVSFTRISIVFPGERVTLLGRNADASWANVRLANGQTGWVSIAFITPSVPITNLAVTG